MKFEELTPEQISDLSEIYWNRNLAWDERMKQLSQYLGKSERTAQSWVSKLGITEKSIQESPELIKAKERKFNKRKKRAKSDQERNEWNCCKSSVLLA